MTDLKPSREEMLKRIAMEIYQASTWEIGHWEYWGGGKWVVDHEGISISKELAQTFVNNVVGVIEASDTAEERQEKINKGAKWFYDKDAPLEATGEQVRQFFGLIKTLDPNVLVRMEFADSEIDGVISLLQSLKPKAAPPEIDTRIDEILENYESTEEAYQRGVKDTLQKQGPSVTREGVEKQVVDIAERYVDFDMNENPFIGKQGVHEIRKLLQKQGPSVTREWIGVIVQSLQDFKGHEAGMKYLANKLTEAGVKINEGGQDAG